MLVRKLLMVALDVLKYIRDYSSNNCKQKKSSLNVPCVLAYEFVTPVS